MGTFRRLPTLTVVFFLTTIAPWAPAKPLASDPRLVTGKLDNGVRWIFRRHANPPGRAAFMMHVKTGSLNETDEQRGLAHFMEHMVFNGTEHFPPGELIPYFESIGMTFGSDLNANTSFERTVYMLFIPSTEAGQVEKALTVLSDYAFRASLSEKEIDQERSVILEEARGKKSAEQRIRDKLWPEMFAGSRLADRLPIGDEKVIASAPRDEIAGYYRTWYRPENIALLIVADADPEPMVPLIEKWFGEYEADALPRLPRRAELRPFTDPRAILVTDPEIAACTVQMVNLLPGRPPVTTVEQYRTEILEKIGELIMDRRLDERVKKGEAAYRKAEAGVMTFLNEALLVVGSAEGEPADWTKMLDELVVEVNRACRHGFTERELDLAKQEIQAARERAVRTESTIDARTVIQSMMTAVNERRPILGATQELDLTGGLLTEITAAEVSETFKARFGGNAYAYVVEAPEQAGVTAPGRDEILAIAKAAWERPVEPLREKAGQADLLAALPEPGRIAETIVDEELGITSAWLENGIRIHHRFMDDKKDTVMVSVDLAGGGIEETAANIGVSLVAGLAVSTAATDRLSSTEIRDLMVGRNVKVGGGPVEDDAFVLRIGGSPRDLDIGLQLLHALLMEGRVEPSAFENWKLLTLREIEKNDKNVVRRAGDALGDLLSGGDPRRMSVKMEQVEALTVEAGQAWFDRLRRTAPIEATVVGDVRWDDVRPLVERYLGSLSARPRAAKHLDELRQLARPDGPLDRRVEVATVTPTALVYVGFVGAEGPQTIDRRALSVADNVLATRLNKRLREELGLVYSIDVRTQTNWVYRDSSVFRASARCDPKNADQVAGEIHAAFTAFAEAGPSPVEMENARKQILNNLETSRKDPRYWMDLLENLDLHGRSLDEARSHVRDYESLTADHVRDAFSKYCTPARTFTVTAAPASRLAADHPGTDPGP